MSMWRSESSRHANKAALRRRSRCWTLALLVLAGGCVHTSSACGTSTSGLPGLVDLFAGAPER